MFRATNFYLLLGAEAASTLVGSALMLLLGTKGGKRIGSLIDGALHDATSEDADSTDVDQRR
jgi:hypothetical protein